MDMAVVGGMLVGFLVAAIIGLLFAGLVLKFSVRLVEGFSPGYGRSLLVVFLAAVTGFIVNVVTTMVLGVGTNMAAMGADADPAAAMAAMGSSMLLVWGISLVAGLVINAAFINLLIKHPDGRAIGFGRSLLVALLYLMVMVVLTVVISIVLGVVLGLGAAGMAGAMG
ncbi:hypothetical protein [Arenimonas terrae]|jgi:hypothetical protein|uniref:Uncharacterized protein n=1 Tax=Arenimonas terrae TaxID=2546226 RepID=A0A5C4RWG0_9GAMM|nr:hypothetical protein [Arenimonas terrae]TNJ35603.1 hypothetical protein E1B00_07605 [Arenimonas terrae]